MLPTVARFKVDAVAAFPLQTTQRATLSLPDGGRMADAAVQIGDVDKADDSLASLETTALAADWRCRRC